MIEITKECIGCGGCLEICPEDAISLCSTQSIVNHYKCLECHICISACPVEAIKEVKE